MNDRVKKDAWLERVLGVSFAKSAQASAEPPKRQVRFAPVPQDVRRPPEGGAVRLGQGGARAHAVIAPPVTPRGQEIRLAGDKKLVVAQLPGGKVSYTAPPPPVREITFSGGGGKGVALPGAVKALEASGVLADAKKIAGASVGSMTAALVAAGIKAKDFEAVANDRSTTDTIVEGTGGTKLGLLGAAMSNKGSPLTGEGLQEVVARVLDETLRKRIEEYLTGCRLAMEQPSPQVMAVAQQLDRRGPTFGDLRKLSKVIPEVKEVVITGTYMTEYDLKAMGSDGGGGVKEVWSKDEQGNTRGQLYVFDADSEPDLEVAVAVHASASFPKAFKPVDIKLSTGQKVRFVDGGVMNNTPTASSIGAERQLDPLPQGRGITFVFEDKDGTSDDLLKGKVEPGVGKMARVIDWFIDSDHHAAEYAKNRDMADRPEEIVVVPLKITMPGKGGKKGKKVDMRGGTLEFNLAPQKAIALQQATEQVTLDRIASGKADRTCEFESDSQMFVSIGLPELEALAGSGYPKAAEALEFRRNVAELVDALARALKDVTSAGGHAKDLLDERGDHAMLGEMEELESLAGSDVDFQGYVAREMNRGRLDPLIDAMRRKGAAGPVAGAALAVEETLRARSFADNILKQLVYPKMTREKKGSSGLDTLMVVEGLLRAARSAADVNDAIDIAVEHFRGKSDRLPPKAGHKEFAAEIARRKMPAGA